MGASEDTFVDVADVGRNRQVLMTRVCGALVVVVFLAGIAGLAAVSPARSWTPAQQLARVRQFVTSARTARFTGTSTWSSGSGKGQLGSHFEHTSRAAGVLSLPDRSHWTEDYGDGATETIVAPDAVFERDADTVPALAAEQWKQYPHDPKAVAAAPLAHPNGDPASGIHAVVGEAGGVVSALGAPAEFTDVLAHVTNLTRVDQRVIRATLNLAALPDVPAGAGPLPTVTVELASDTNGHLERLLVNATGTASDANSPDESFTARTEMLFSHWGAPVDVSVPNADHVDRTPDVDEESLAAFTAAPILVPGNLPPTYELTYATTSKPGNSGDCAEADLTYGDPAKEAAADPNVGSASEINVTITPAACDTSPMDGDATTVAGHPAHITHGDVNNDDSATTVDLVIGATRMTVDSDLPEAQLLSALRTIVPFDLAKQHIATSPQAAVTS